MYKYIDMHCDTLLASFTKGAAAIYNGDTMQNLQMMKEADVLCQFFAVYFPQRIGSGARPDDIMDIPEDIRYYELLKDNLLSQVSIHSDIAAMAYSYEDILANAAAGKTSAMLTIEDGRMVNGDMSMLEKLYADGVRAIALLWNYPNCFGYPNFGNINERQRGLTDFGCEAIEVMNELGILVDVSHLSDGGFYDVAALSRKPFIASHSNCRELSPHPRNLTDDMIRILAQKGGVAGLNFASEFLAEDTACQTSRIADMVAHVKHFINVGGEDCVGIGTDSDGIECNLEITNTLGMYRLFDALQAAGVTSRQLDKLSSCNVLRVLKNI